MQQRNSDSWLFLDFDGVICDSLEECFQSSWLTLSGTMITESVPPPAPFPDDYRERFLACRPFIRSGEDYIVLHRLVEEHRVPGSQEEFDRELRLQGRPALDDIKRRLYDVREALLARHRQLWLSWNPLFPGIAEALNALAHLPRVRILSTKRSEFIAEVLAHHGVQWPLAHILYSGNQRKLDFVERLAGKDRALLIDDQIDHLDFDHPTCQCVLAGWGYVGPGARERSRTFWTLDQALRELRAWV